MVLRGVGRLKEIEETWTLEDVWDAHQALDIEEDIEIVVTRKAREKDS